MTTLDLTELKVYVEQSLFITQRKVYDAHTRTGDLMGRRSPSVMGDLMEATNNLHAQVYNHVLLCSVMDILGRYEFITHVPSEVSAWILNDCMIATHADFTIKDAIKKHTERALKQAGEN